MQAVQTVSCEGQDRAPPRRDVAGKLLPVHLALIHVKDGAHSEFPGAIKTPSSPKFWSDLLSGFRIITQTLQVSAPTKRGAYISETFHRGVYRGAERERHLPKGTQHQGFRPLGSGSGVPLSACLIPRPLPPTGAVLLPCGRCSEAFYAPTRCAVSSHALSGAYPASVLPDG